jgi:hypothetical protein
MTDQKELSSDDKSKESESGDLKFNKPKCEGSKDILTDAKVGEQFMKRDDKSEKPKMKEESKELESIDAKKDIQQSKGHKEGSQMAHKTEDSNPLSLWDLDVFNISDSFKKIHESFQKKFESFEQEMEETRKKSLEQW